MFPEPHLLWDLWLISLKEGLGQLFWLSLLSLSLKPPPVEMLSFAKLDSAVLEVAVVAKSRWYPLYPRDVKVFSFLLSDI